MINESQQEQASLYVLGALTPEEEQVFAAELSRNSELRELVRSLENTAGALARTAPPVAPPPHLKNKVLRRIQSIGEAKPQPPSTAPMAAALAAGHRFINADDSSGWKQLPVPGAWIKLLSFEAQRGYAVLMGRLEAGVRYPAHTNAGPEDFLILSGDLVVGDRTLRAGDFHHADAGSLHAENYSVGGCTLIAVLTVDDPLVAFARA